MTEAEVLAKAQTLAGAGCSFSAGVLALAAERDRAIEGLVLFRRLLVALDGRLGEEVAWLDARRAASPAVAVGNPTSAAMSSRSCMAGSPGDGAGV